MSYATLITVVKEGTCVITINRPEKLNALNKEVLQELSIAMDDVYQNADIKSAIITGSGAKSFVAGADISEFVGLSKTQAMQLSIEGQNVFFKIENCLKSVYRGHNWFGTIFYLEENILPFN